ncbi:MAG: methylmalonyl-CoA epimerase [Rhizobium sp.]|nr:MAG: methylmalonyl-CoA epimerase [Rhizobium sp.]
MFGRLNHVALAVPDLNAAVSRYRALGARVSEPQSLPEHGVTVVFIQAENTKIELLHPLGENFEVPDILAARDDLIQKGVRILGDGTPKIGAHGNPVLFLHPKDMGGVLYELEQVSQTHG